MSSEEKGGGENSYCRSSEGYHTLRIWEPYGVGVNIYIPVAEAGLYEEVERNSATLNYFPTKHFLALHSCPEKAPGLLRRGGEGKCLAVYRIPVYPAQAPYLTPVPLLFVLVDRLLDVIAGDYYIHNMDYSLRGNETYNEIQELIDKCTGLRGGEGYIDSSKYSPIYPLCLERCARKTVEILARIFTVLSSAVTVSRCKWDKQRLCTVLPLRENGLFSATGSALLAKNVKKVVEAFLEDIGSCYAPVCPGHGRDGGACEKLSVFQLFKKLVEVLLFARSISIAYICGKNLCVANYGATTAVNRVKELLESAPEPGGIDKSVLRKTLSFYNTLFAHVFSLYQYTTMMWYSRVYGINPWPGSRSLYDMVGLRENREVPGVLDVKTKLQQILEDHRLLRGTRLRNVLNIRGDANVLLDALNTYMEMVLYNPWIRVGVIANYIRLLLWLVELTEKLGNNEKHSTATGRQFLEKIGRKKEEGSAPGTSLIVVPLAKTSTPGWPLEPLSVEVPLSPKTARMIARLHEQPRPYEQQPSGISNIRTAINMIKYEIRGLSNSLNKVIMDALTETANKHDQASSLEEFWEKKGLVAIVYEVLNPLVDFLTSPWSIDIEASIDPSGKKVGIAKLIAERVSGVNVLKVNMYMVLDLEKIIRGKQRLSSTIAPIGVGEEVVYSYSLEELHSAVLEDPVLSDLNQSISDQLQILATGGPA